MLIKTNNIKFDDFYKFKHKYILDNNKVKIDSDIFREYIDIKSSYMNNVINEAYLSQNELNKYYYDLKKLIKKYADQI